jgi:hypothetical protein
MPSFITSRLITRKFRVFNAEQFKEAFNESPTSSLYLFIGRVSPWPNSDTPVTLGQSVISGDYDPWLDMLAAKKLGTNDVSLAIPRINWTSGTVYKQYDNTTDVDLQGNALNYVFTTARNVYKCIFNNRGAQSTTEPTGTNTFIFDTADGYKWKFMYTITAAEALDFITPFFIPVKRITVNDGSPQFTVQQAAVNGAIHIINVTANGSNYIERKNTIGSVTNTSVISLDSGASTVDNQFTGQSIFISAGLGAGQLRNITNYVGELRRVVVSPSFTITPNTTSSFHVGPRITITGDGTGATAYANVAAGQIKQINMVGIGSGYSKATVQIAGSFGAGAAGKVVISPIGGHGSSPVDELFGHNLTLSTRLFGTEGNTIPSNNDFRKIGLLVDPILSSNGSIATDLTYDQTTRLNVVNLTGTPAPDEIINGQVSGASARVVYFANNNSIGTIGHIKVVSVNGVFQNETITGNTSGVTGNVTSVTPGSFVPFRGTVLYVENRPASVRTFDQIEDIKLTLQY